MAPGRVLAEGEGFEPPVGCPTTVFKTAALNHSANLPWLPSWAAGAPDGKKPCRAGGFTVRSILPGEMPEWPIGLAC